ncbi:hypothetical protein Ancab_012159 [Ancistrocladus abbreviatus]
MSYLAYSQEEKDLINAHQRRVEETMDIIKEEVSLKLCLCYTLVVLFLAFGRANACSLREMNLLDEVDQPGNQLDDYIKRLNAILSLKAAGIVQLQTWLAHFYK